MAREGAPETRRMPGSRIIAKVAACLVRPTYLRNFTRVPGALGITEYVRDVTNRRSSHVPPPLSSPHSRVKHDYYFCGHRFRAADPGTHDGAFFCLFPGLLCDNVSNDDQFFHWLTSDLQMAKKLNGWFSAFEGAFTLLPEGLFIAALHNASKTVQAPSLVAHLKA